MENNIRLDKQTTISIPLFCLIVTIGSIIGFIVAETKKKVVINNEIALLKAEVLSLKKFDEKQILINERNDKATEEINISLQELKSDSKWIIQLLQEQREKK